MKLIKVLFVTTSIILGTGWSASGVPLLFEAAVNMDGTITSGAPSGIDSATGLGTATFTFLGGGAHYFGIFFDHEIDATTYTSETGSANGSLSDGQSWEIDEPGYINGDIYQNFSNGTLDNNIGTSIFGNTTFPDDVSTALAWSFFGPGLITVTVSETAPVSGFYLRQSHSDGLGNLFISGSLTAMDPGTNGVPDGGATLVLLFVGVAGLLGLNFKFR